MGEAGVYALFALSALFEPIDEEKPMFQSIKTSRTASQTASWLLKPLSLALITITAIMLTAPDTALAQDKVKNGYIEANGVNYYYEIHGSGEPLLLLHGGLGSIDMFGPVLPALAKTRQVVAVDLHGHGRTALGERPFSIVAMGNDMAVILAELGYQQVDVLGYSMGGGVGLQLAIQHPEKVRRLVLVGTGYARDGFYPEILAQQAQVGAEMLKAMKNTPMYKSYVAVAPHPEDFPKLLNQIGELMKKPYDWSKDIRQLKMPIMLVFGDSGMYRPEHIVSFYQLLGGGLRDGGWQGQHMSKNRLAILPGLTHYNIFFAPAMLETTLPFLNGNSWSKSWSEQLQQSTKQ